MSPLSHSPSPHTSILSLRLRQFYPLDLEKQRGAVTDDSSERGLGMWMHWSPASRRSASGAQGRVIHQGSSGRVGIELH